MLAPLALDDCLETEDELHVASLLKLGVWGGMDGGGGGVVERKTNERRGEGGRGSEMRSLPDVERSCLNGCLLFLVVENGVIGAFGRSRFLCGSFSMSFL